METLLTRDETHDISRHNVPPNMHQSRLSRGTLVLAYRPILVSDYDQSTFFFGFEETSSYLSV